MKTLLTLLLLICFGYAANAQILNAESLRKVTDTSGFSGNVNLQFALKRNVNDFLTLSSNAHLQYKMNSHLILFKNDILFQKISGDRFENRGIQHLRYNKKWTNRITFEIFTQTQFNKVSKIDFRGLLGAGPRFKLTNSEEYKFYLGTLLMYEHEELDDGVTPIQRDLRGSIYLSFSLYPTENISLVSTTYYQPKLAGFSDYRISSQSSFRVGLYKNFDLLLRYTFTYDVMPAFEIPNSQYDFTTGIAYSFD